MTAVFFVRLGERGSVDVHAAGERAAAAVFGAARVSAPAARHRALGATRLPHRHRLRRVLHHQVSRVRAIQWQKVQTSEKTRHMVQEYKKVQGDLIPSQESLAFDSCR